MVKRARTEIRRSAGLVPCIFFPVLMLPALAIAGSGNATLSGRAYAIYRGAEHPADYESVEVLPVNPYTTQIVSNLLAGRLMSSDPRLTRYRHAAGTDSNGNFAIHRLSAGEYYVISVAEWHHQYDMENGDDSGTTKVTADYKKYIFAKIQVRAGGTTRLTQWNQNCPDVGSPFAHG